MKPSVKTTLYLPEELHIAAKIEAAKRRIPLTKLVILGLGCELRKSAVNSKHYKTEE